MHEPVPAGIVALASTRLMPGHAAQLVRLRVVFRASAPLRPGCSPAASPASRRTSSASPPRLLGTCPGASFQLAGSPALPLPRRGTPPAPSLRRARARPRSGRRQQAHAASRRRRAVRSARRDAGGERPHAHPPRPSVPPPKRPRVAARLPRPSTLSVHPHPHPCLSRPPGPRLTRCRFTVRSLYCP